MAEKRIAVQNVATEWGLISGKRYGDPSADVQLDVVITDPDGGEQRVPAYWAGGGEWRVRYAAHAPGAYSCRTVCSDAASADLHGREMALEVPPYDGDNRLLVHGPLRVSADRRHLEHRDGTPFFYLADTWWMGLCKRMGWPADFQLLTADRAAKGFSAIQIVAGLYPDMPAFDPRGDNEAGWPWEAGFRRINPAYFDMADLRIAHLVRCGLLPCILGCWGYYLPLMGIERMKRHWRCLVARWGAYPVVWCLAGEATMPWYLSKARGAEAAAQKEGWTELARYVRSIDPYGHPITIHPTDYGREQVTDPSVLDFEMLQTGHEGLDCLPHTQGRVRNAVARQPRMPVINAEVCYEGILEGSRQEVQRLMFWSCMLSGACGHTYGAQGIWGVNTREAPFGPSPWGGGWGDTPWEDAYRLPGSEHVAVGKRILSRFEWWRFEPHQEWVEPSAGGADWRAPYAAGIPGEVRVFYFPRPIMPWSGRPTLKALEPGVAYRAAFIDPKSAVEHPAGRAQGDAAGDWPVPQPTIGQDWVLCLERES
jgi:hypothetical protein